MRVVSAALCVSGVIAGCLVLALLAQSRHVEALGGTSGVAILAGWFAASAVAIFALVRRPYIEARRYAIDLEVAYGALQEGTLETFAALNATVEAKDRYTAGHGLRVTLVSLLIGKEMGLSEDELEVLRNAATFHDIGKIAVPDNVLLKPGRLTDAEFAAMKLHAAESERICSKIAALRDCLPAIRHHHERLDGRGYPDGLAGSRIPLGARIIAVADTWDAITSDRPYRAGQLPTLALDEIRRVAGRQFDERVVDAFVRVLAKDPWMFGLTPADVRRNPSAPNQRIDGSPRSSEAMDPAPLVPLSSSDAAEIDWSVGFDDIAA